MHSAAALRLQIERDLQHRFPAALTPVQRTIREVAATGIAPVDELLDGGLPIGAITELTGPESSGRTSLALKFLAQRTGLDRFCAWVDANDAFDPESAAANGLSLRQLLWVRCGDGSAADCAAVGRPSAAKAGLWAKPWTRLDQALQATDLLLQAGGFAAIVLDLGGIAPEHGGRIPSATWFRFRQAADHARCSLVVLGKTAYAQSSAAVVLKCAPMRARTAGGVVLHGFSLAVHRERERFTAMPPETRKPTGPPTTDLCGWGGKPPASTWTASAAWDAENRGPHGQILVRGVKKSA